MNQFNFNHFYYFYIVAKLDGVTTAAKYLNTSQSSLSIQLKALEMTLDKKLFKKSGRKIELTHFGKNVYQYCRRSFENFEMLFNRLNQKSHVLGPRLSIGVSNEIDRPFLADILAKIIKRYPHEKRPTLNLISLQTPHLLQSLKTSEIDLLLTGNAFVDQNIEIKKEFLLPVGIFGTSSLKKELRDLNFEKKLRNQIFPIVLPSQLIGLRSELDNFFIKNKLNPNCTFESNIMSSVVRAATDGFGVIISPRAYVLHELRSGKLFPLNNKVFWKHRLLLLSTKNSNDEYKTEFAERFVQQFLSEIEL